jgi:ABC-2 type transport system ATP-binding protein
MASSYRRHWYGNNPTKQEATMVIEVRGLRKRYGDHLVVDGVDLDVAEGEIVGLLGANGAGKTTTVECIQGLRRADEGFIRVLGIDPAANGDRLRSLIGSQLQASALPDRLRVSEAVELFRRAGAPRADGLLSAFGLADLSRTAFSALSGGQQQRLFLVLALLNRPQLVILDELTQGLDPASRRDVWDAILSLRDAGTTVLLVTHYMDEAEALCDRVVVLRAGRIVDAGRPSELVDRHARWATMQFGCPPGVTWPDGLAAIDGVQRVRRSSKGVELFGDRRMIAYVCADLVQRGEVPRDLSIAMPDLEDALVALLSGDDTQPKLTIGAPR